MVTAVSGWFRLLCSQGGREMTTFRALKQGARCSELLWLALVWAVIMVIAGLGTKEGFRQG